MTIHPKVGDKPKLVTNDCSSVINGYRQVYVIKQKREGIPDGFREVFFQCGNWCYDGTIPLEFLQQRGDEDVMSLSDIPKVAPALQKHQDNLSFVCVSSK